MTENEKINGLANIRQRNKILQEACSLKVAAKFEYDDDAPPFFLNFKDMNNEMLFLQFSKIEIKENLTLPLEGKIHFSIERLGYYYFKTIFEEKHFQNFFSCAIPIPYSLHKIQRRQNFRISPPPELPATLVSIAGKDLKGKIIIKNISQGGARLAFPTEAKVPLGTTLPDICIQLKNEGDIKLNGIVRLVKKESEQITILGLQWSQMTQDSFKKLKKYLLNCQRQMARNKKN